MIQKIEINMRAQKHFLEKSAERLLTVWLPEFLQNGLQDLWQTKVK